MWIITLIKEDIKNIIYELESYEKNFIALINLIRKRGFKDDGLEGRMREQIHLIESMERGISKIDMLMLRRHEKDYIIRKDKKYAQLLDDKVKEILESINAANLNAEEKIEISGLISGYSDDFKELIKLEDQIGINNSTGKKRQMRNHADHLTSLLNSLLKKINKEIFMIRSRQIQFFYGIIFVAVVLSLFLSYYLANKVTKPIFKLSIAIQHIVEKNFEGDLSIVHTKSKDEIGELTHNFNAMLSELQRRFNEIKEQNQELEVQNEELNALNTQLSTSQNKLKNVIHIKDKFFSIISHDLRDPLSTLLMFMKTLETKVNAFSKDQIKEFSIENQKSLIRVIDLLENLLQWSLSESGELKFNPEQIQLNPTIEENINLYRKKAKENKNIEILFEPKEDTKVFADKNMLNFVLRNLISNALKFSYPDSKVYISTDISGQNVKVSVRDEGLGMSETVLHKVLNSEEHLSTLGTHNEKGTGFGLLLCRSFIEQNKGKFKYSESITKRDHSGFYSKKPEPDHSEKTSKIQSKLIK